jgi:hypothetical protein
VSKASAIVATLRELVGFGLHIGDVNRLTVEDCTPGDNPTCQGQRVTPHWNGGYRPMVRYEALTVTVHLKDRRVIGVAKAGCARCDFFEHTLQVRRRP